MLYSKESNPKMQPERNGLKDGYIWNNIVTFSTTPMESGLL